MKEIRFQIALSSEDKITPKEIEDALTYLMIDITHYVEDQPNSKYYMGNGKINV